MCLLYCLMVRLSLLSMHTAVQSETIRLYIRDQGLSILSSVRWFLVDKGFSQEFPQNLHFYSMLFDNVAFIVYSPIWRISRHAYWKRIKDGDNVLRNLFKENDSEYIIGYFYYLKNQVFLSINSFDSVISHFRRILIHPCDAHHY